MAPLTHASPKTGIPAVFGVVFGVFFDARRGAWQAGGVTSPSAASAGHISVLASEVVRALAPALDTVAQGVLVDATAGLGGHTAALLGGCRPRLAVLLDRDRDALALASQRLADAQCPTQFVHAPFSQIQHRLEDLGVSHVAAILADLGVSSIQLDRIDRGFSFRGDAPLDMRMDPTRGPTAAAVLAEIDARSLARLLREFGEEPDAPRIAAAIIKLRPTTTRELAEIVRDAMSGRQRRKLGLRINPATRTFQALRIHVNDEMGELDRFLNDAPELLAVGGRLAIITFHSLEDRRVKRRFRELSSPPPLPHNLPVTEAERPRARFSTVKEFARGATATPDELDANPRARSARLRVLQRDLP